MASGSSRMVSLCFIQQICLWQLSRQNERLPITWDESSPEIVESDTAYWDYFVEGAKDIAAARTANHEKD
jgi:hypothetical protein